MPLEKQESMQCYMISIRHIVYIFANMMWYGTYWATRFIKYCIIVIHVTCLSFIYIMEVCCNALRQLFCDFSVCHISENDGKHSFYSLMPRMNTLKWSNIRCINRTKWWKCTFFMSSPISTSITESKKTIFFVEKIFMCCEGNLLTNRMHSKVNLNKF